MNKERRERKHERKQECARLRAQLEALQVPRPVLFPTSTSRDVVVQAGVASAQGAAHKQGEEGRNA